MAWHDMTWHDMWYGGTYDMVRVDVWHDMILITCLFCWEKTFFFQVFMIGWVMKNLMTAATATAVFVCRRRVVGVCSLELRMVTGDNHITTIIVLFSACPSRVDNEQANERLLLLLLLVSPSRKDDGG